MSQIYNLLNSCLDEKHSYRIHTPDQLINVLTADGFFINDSRAEKLSSIALHKIAAHQFGPYAKDNAMHDLIEWISTVFCGQNLWEIVSEKSPIELTYVAPTKYFHSDSPNRKRLPATDSTLIAWEGGLFYAPIKTFLQKLVQENLIRDENELVHFFPSKTFKVKSTLLYDTTKLLS